MSRVAAQEDSPRRETWGYNADGIWAPLSVRLAPYAAELMTARSPCANNAARLRPCRRA